MSTCEECLKLQHSIDLARSRMRRHELETVEQYPSLWFQGADEAIRKAKRIGSEIRKAELKLEKHRTKKHTES